MGWGSSPLPAPPFYPGSAPETGGGFSREHAAGITGIVFSSKRMDAMSYFESFSDKTGNK